jgi:hypothetical protein
MYQLTKAYHIWKDAPMEIHDATTPEDFAKGWEVKFLEVDGEIAHFFQHLKQWLWWKFDLYPNSMRIEYYCNCDKFERWGL